MPGPALPPARRTSHSSVCSAGRLTHPGSFDGRSLGNFPDRHVADHRHHPLSRECCSPGRGRQDIYVAERRRAVGDRPGRR
jgi:hypothetical protein